MIPAPQSPRARWPVAAAAVLAMALAGTSAIAQPAPDGSPPPPPPTPGYQVAPGGPPPNGGIPNTNPGTGRASHQGRMSAKFEAANTTRDGHLTLAQARAAKMHSVIRDFNAIDSNHNGYITLEQLRAYKRAHPRHRPTDSNTSPGHI